MLDEETPSWSQFESAYKPAETVLHTTDPNEAYEQAQGYIVNQEQKAVHMVRSASVGDIIEVVNPDGSTEYHLVERIGCSKLPFPEEPEQPTPA